MISSTCYALRSLLPPFTSWGSLPELPQKEVNDIKHLLCFKVLATTFYFLGFSPRVTSLGL
jgi:hypothetical protein